MNLSELRTLFPHTRDTIYLNHAATAPLSTRVVSAVSAYLEQRHRTNIENYADFAPTLESARSRAARLVGADVARVEFAPNTSYALNVLAQGFPWRRGDRIAVPSCEFPANVYPFLNLERQGVVVDFIPHTDGVISLDDIERTLRPETRLLTISWVQFLSGYRIDVEAVGRLCRDRGVLFCVDAIQGLGALRLDVDSCGIDFLASGGHKWLMAMQGIGFLYVSEDLQSRLEPAAGWLHGPVDWDNFFDYELAFHPDATRFRLGTMNNAGIASLEAALELYVDAGASWCEERVLARAGRLAAGLDAFGFRRYGTADPAHASGIVTVEHRDVEALHAYLQQHGVAAAVRQRKLRFAPTYYNTDEEIDRVLELVGEFVRR